jgi:hypothetical protein
LRVEHTMEAERDNAAILIQTCVRAYLTRVKIVHQSRAQFLSVAEGIMRQVFEGNEEHPTTSTLNYKHNRKLGRPIFTQTRNETFSQRIRRTSDNDNDDDDYLAHIDVRSTAELEEELRQVRKKLGLTSQASTLAAQDNKFDWKGEFNCFINPSLFGPVYLIPCGESFRQFSHDNHTNESTEMKFITTLNGGMVFFMTAFNPRGFICTMDENNRANVLLLKELQKFRRAYTSELWRGFRAHVEQNWRVDGFALFIKGRYIEEQRNTWNEISLGLLRIAHSVGHDQILSYRVTNEGEGGSGSSTIVCESLVQHNNNVTGVTCFEMVALPVEHHSLRNSLLDPVFSDQIDMSKFFDSS